MTTESQVTDKRTDGQEQERFILQWNFRSLLNLMVRKILTQNKLTEVSGESGIRMRISLRLQERKSECILILILRKMKKFKSNLRFRLSVKRMLWKIYKKKRRIGILKT